MILKKKKKNVLIIASNFPPSERVGGVIRIAKLIKYLPSNNWKPYVITTKRSQKTKNDSLFNEIKDLCVIYKIPEFDLRKLYHFFNFFRNKSNPFKVIAKPEKHTIINKESGIPISSHFLVPDHLFIWAIIAFFKSIFICIYKKIDVIYATSPSQSGLLVGLFLKYFLKIPFVVDLRDPWTTNPFHIKRMFSFLNKFEDRLELSVLNKADKIIVINDFFTKSICEKYPEIDKEKFNVVPNGFDLDDFKNITPIKSKKHTIVHAGNFYLGRSALPFLRAFASSINQNTNVAKNWELTLVGSGGEYKSEIETLGISNHVNIIGPVPHKVAISYILGSTVLLLIPGIGKSTLTGKVFEYIAAKKPIFVMSDESAATKLVEGLGIGISCSENDLSELTDSLLSFMDKYNSFLNQQNLDIEVSKYDRKSIAYNCSNIMNELIV